MLQTILGGGGVIGEELARELHHYETRIRIVSRNPSAVNENDEIMPVDLANKEQVNEAVKGSDVAYLTAGLKYDTKTWKAYWPLIMSNVLEACKKHQTKLVFFDNVYIYGKVDGIMTEETPVNPCSKKGEVRAKIAAMMMNEINKGNVTGLIARSADFYGPRVWNSIPENTIIQNFKKGRKAQLFCSDQFVHSYTYTPDAGKATALLGNTDKAFGKVWHLPTRKDPMDGKSWVASYARHFKVKPDYFIVRKWLVSLIGLFSPIMGELREMLYQYDRDYIFDSSKFEREFQFQPTPYEEGIARSVEAALR